MKKSPLILPNQDIFMPGTVKPEADYEELNRLACKLGIPVPMMQVSFVATDEKGNETGRFEDRSRTTNRNFWNNLFNSYAAAPSGTATFGAGFLTLKNTAAALVNPNADTNGSGATNPRNFVFGSGIGTLGTAQGLVVGTGTAAESFEDYALGALIAHGNGAGQLAHSAQNATTLSYNSGSKTWTATLARIFNNNSGGTIVVGECGIYGVMNAQVYMFCRDKLGATVSVLNTGQGTLTYTSTLTFPA